MSWILTEGDSAVISPESPCLHATVNSAQRLSSLSCFLGSGKTIGEDMTEGKIILAVETGQRSSLQWGERKVHLVIIVEII